MIHIRGNGELSSVLLRSFSKKTGKGTGKPQNVYVPPFIDLMSLSKKLRVDWTQALDLVGFRKNKKFHCTYRTLEVEGRHRTIKESNYLFENRKDIIIPFDISRKIFQRLYADKNAKILLQETEPEIPQLEPRDPESSEPHKQGIAVLLGHYNHGKTTLLDTLMKTKLQKGEAYGITQEIRGCSVRLLDQFVTFIDTPGQDIFYRMRSNGAGVADMAVLVVSMVDGICEQTKECIEAIESLQLPVVVALNKMDLVKEENQIQETIDSLNEYECLKDALKLPISAVTKQGVDKLSQAIVGTIGNLSLPSLKDCESFPGWCTAIDIKRDPKNGHQFLLLVHTGVIKAGQVFACGYFWGKIRTLLDPITGQGVKKAHPGQCVRVSCVINNFNQNIPLGENFWILNSSRAERVSECRIMEKNLIASEIPQENMLKPDGFYEEDEMDDFESNMLDHDEDDETLDRMIEEEENPVVVEDSKEVCVIVKADIGNTMATILDAIQDISEMDSLREVHVLRASIGTIGINDIKDAHSVKCPIFAFNVSIDKKAKELAGKYRVPIIYSQTVQHLLDEVDYFQASQKGFINPVEVSKQEWAEKRIAEKAKKSD